MDKKISLESVANRLYTEMVVADPEMEHSEVVKLIARVTNRIEDRVEEVLVICKKV